MADNDEIIGNNYTNEDLVEEGLLTEPLDPLSLDDIDDEELVRITDKRIDTSHKFFESDYDLYERRKKNEIYYFGKQILELEEAHLLKEYNSRFMDNVLYEIEATIKPLAMSRLPDMIVTPGNESEESRLMAEEISKAIDTQCKSRESRKVLGIAFKHLPVYFTGVIKTRWDAERDDYVFETIHPDLIEIDSTSPSNNADDMQFVSQILPLTVEQVVMRFPNKKEDFFRELNKSGLQVGENPEGNWRFMATTIKIREIWFTWYKKKSNTAYQRIDGVMWKYKDCILKKMKNPNFDYEGEQKFFIEDSAGTKKELTEELAKQILITGQIPEQVTQEQVYHNYFDAPKKPFFFLGYDQWGRIGYDETSRVEQNLPNQKAIDKRGQQIEETLDNRGHHIWGKDSGLKPADIENMDMNDKDTDVVVDGIPSQVHEFIPPDRPTPQEFEDMQSIRDRMYGLSGSNSVRGEVKNDTPATSEQIGREANFTRADDVVEDTINAAAEWMASYSLQFIKLRYTEDHFKKILGVAGSVVFLKLNRDMIEDGMEVMIKSSGTDKLKSRNDAMDLLSKESIDPINLFRDLGYPDFEQRAAMLISFMNMKGGGDPTYQLKYLEGLNTSQDMANALMGAPIPPSNPPPPMPPGAPQGPSPLNTANAPIQPPVGAPNGSPRQLG